MLQGENELVLPASSPSLQHGLHSPTHYSSECSLPAITKHGHQPQTASGWPEPLSSPGQDHAMRTPTSPLGEKAGRFWNSPEKSQLMCHSIIVGTERRKSLLGVSQCSLASVGKGTETEEEITEKDPGSSREVPRREGTES